MKTEVAILHHDYPPRVREYVEEKLEHLTRFHERIISVRATVGREGETHRVELVANVGRGAILVADTRDDAFGTALDEALDRMGRQLKRHHDKITRERHRAGRSSPKDNVA